MTHNGGQPRSRDRKSVVEGKSVDLGGRRIIKKNNASIKWKDDLAGEPVGETLPEEVY